MRRIIQRAAIAASAVALIVGLAACGSNSDGDQPRSVTVVGTGKVIGTPDTLKADVGIEAEGNDVSAALNDANDKVAKITDAAVNAGVDRKDIATQNVTLNPRYNSPAPGSTSQISGYTATNSLRITMRDLTKASNVLAATATAGGNNTRISNVSFSIDDDSDLMKQARDAAFNDARSRAGQYAKLADDSLGKVLVITEASSAQEPVTRTPSTYRADAAVSPVPVEPGQQTLTFSVTVKYALD